MKRIVLFLLTNLGVMLVLGIAVNVLGLNRFLSQNGLDLPSLLGFSLVMGFGGAFISLLISKPMAKWSTGAQVINDSPDATHQWLVTTVQRFADKAGIAMPEVAIFQGEPNAFATGAFKNSALVDTTWQESPKGPPRKYYALSAAGRAELAAQTVTWRELVTAMESLLPEESR
mgnify:CR=1 FL=1